MLKAIKYPYDMIHKEFGFDPIRKEYDITKKHVDNFYNDCFGKLIPIRTELVVFDREYKIGGMVDMLFYNVKAKEYQIWDWKTNKSFSYVNEYGESLKDPLMFLSDCDHEIYSLQLETYKHIIEKNTNIKLGDSYLVWFSHNNDNYKIIL